MKSSITNSVSLLAAIAWSLMAAQGALATPAVEPSASSGSGTLQSIVVAAEGRLLRVRMIAAGPILRYTLSRQGPPEKRDLVLRLPGFTSTNSTRIDTADYLLPVDLAAEETTAGREAGIKVVLGDVGDSLVSVGQDGAELSLVIIPPAKKSDVADAYRIGANDSLQVDVFGHEDLNKTLKVSPRGLINFPLIGNVRAEGRSVDDVAAEITERLSKDFLQDPHVTVSVWEYLSQWVNVIGEVAHPGRYYLTGATTLIDAISQAGGLAAGAGSEILITRRAEEVDPASAGEVFHVEIKALFSSEGGKLNQRLRPGDIVNILAAESPRAARP